MRQMPKLWTSMSDTRMRTVWNKARVFPGFTGFPSWHLVQRCTLADARTLTSSDRSPKSHRAGMQLRSWACALRQTPRLRGGRPRGAAFSRARPCPAGAPPEPRRGGRWNGGAGAPPAAPRLPAAPPPARRGELAGLHPQKQAGGYGGFFSPTPRPAATRGSKKKLGQG